MLPVSLLAIITASFFLLALLPGDIPHAILGQIATPEAIAQLKARLGLDQSVFERFYHYVGGLLHGSLGESYYTGQSVLGEIGSRLPSTLELVIPGLVLAFVLGVGLGRSVAITTAARRTRRPAACSLSPNRSPTFSSP